MRIENVRLSFPNIFRPSAFSEDQDKKYSATFIVPKDHPQRVAIEAEIERVAKDKWPKGVPKAVKRCLRDGDEEKPDLEGFVNALFFNAANKTRPGVYDRDRSPLTEDDGKPYAGCYVNAVVDFWAQDNQFGKRVNASLGGIQFVRDGDAFGGGRPATAGDFDDVTEDDDFLD